MFLSPRVFADLQNTWDSLTLRELVQSWSFYCATINEFGQSDLLPNTLEYGLRAAIQARFAIPEPGEIKCLTAYVPTTSKAPRFPSYG